VEALSRFDAFSSRALTRKAPARGLRTGAETFFK
jgi:hypothetical protein